MSDLGSLLRRRREEKGLSLDEVSALTKIHKRHLDAIERGRWHLLPEPFYTRAFLRHIAEQIDLDPEYVLSEYALETQTALSPSSSRHDQRERRKKRRAMQMKVRRWVIALFLLVVGAVAFVYIGRMF